MLITFKFKYVQVCLSFSILSLLPFPLLLFKMDSKENSAPQSSSGSQRPTIQHRTYPRYYDSEADLEQFIGAKQLTLNFSPTTKQVKNVLPEDSEEFWCTPDAKSIHNVLVVKRFSCGLDFMHLMRINQKVSASKFKYPNSLTGVLIAKLSEIMLKLEVTPDGVIVLPDAPFVSREDLTKESFWTGEDCIKLCAFYMKPYMSEYNTLMFRLHQRIPEKNFRTFTDNGVTTTWMGPAASISLPVAEGLLKVLKELK